MKKQAWLIVYIIIILIVNLTTNINSNHQLSSLIKAYGATAVVAGIIYHSLVAPHVKGEMVGAREGTNAYVALERFVTGVLSIVSGQLVGTSKAPVAP